MARELLDSGTIQWAEQCGAAEYTVSRVLVE